MGVSPEKGYATGRATGKTPGDIFGSGPGRGPIVVSAARFC
jgi:hypothetical protein